MTTVYFTSDLHLGHAKIAEIRGFDSIEDHDETILENLRDILRKRDQLYILGDISSGRDKGEEQALEHLNTLKTDIGIEMHGILGNHDSASNIHRNAHKHFRAYANVFDSIQQFARRKIAGQQVLLSHFPYQGDSGSMDRYREFRLRDWGYWLLHGHTHQSQPFRPDYLRQINVGVDAWNMKPVSINTITDFINKTVLMVPGVPGDQPREIRN